MTSAATMIREGRSRLGLTTRDLATLAEVSYPTVSRIENGHEDPKWSTMTRLGEVLGLAFAPGHPESFTHLADLATDDIADPIGSGHPDFTSLRAFIDQLRNHPIRLAVAIFEPPRATSSKVLDNLLAAIAEKSADDAGIRRPRWTLDVEPLDQPWKPPGTATMRRRNAEQAAQQFIARGLLVDESALWRSTPSTTA